MQPYKKGFWAVPLVNLCIDHFNYSVMLRGDDLVGLADCPLSIQYHTIHYTAKARGFRLAHHSGNLELATCYL